MSQNVDWATTASLTTGGKIKDGAVTGSNIDWTTMRGYNYSTAEQAVGRWIDGKTVCRRVFTGNLSSNQDARITFGRNVDVIKVDGAARYLSGVTSSLLWGSDATSVTIRTTDAGFGGKPYIAIVEYIDRT